MPRGRAVSGRPAKKLSGHLDSRGNLINRPSEIQTLRAAAARAGLDCTILSLPAIRCYRVIMYEHALNRSHLFEGGAEACLQEIHRRGPWTGSPSRPNWANWEPGYVTFPPDRE